MDDELPAGPWGVDPHTRSAMRLDKVRAAVNEGDLPLATIELEELLDEEPHNHEGLFLLGEILLEAGDAQMALLVYERHAELTGGEPAALQGLAISRFETCDVVGALEAAREVVRLTPDNAEAHYYLGLALDWIDGQQAGAIQAYAAARQLDPPSYPYPLDLTNDEWRQAVEAALMRVGDDIRAFWSQVPLRLERRPVLAELRKHDPPIPPTVSGIFMGTPPTEEEDLSRRPAGLRLFIDNLSRAPTFDDVIVAIAETLEQEALGWQGIDDVELS